MSASGQSDEALRAQLQPILDNYLATRGRAEHISAVSLSIGFPDRQQNLNVVSGNAAFGAAKKPIHSDSLFQIGSITKSFTAVALLQLEAEGKLTIDQPLGDFLPEYPAWKSVSLRRLLNMTSGIPTYSESGAIARAEVQSLDRTFTPPQLVAAVDPLYLHAPAPTSGWFYSNTNYILAGMVIERVTGHSYRSELERRYFKPLGLHHTYYRPARYPPDIRSSLVSGYWFNSSPGEETFAPLLRRDVKTGDLSWAGAAGGIIATPEDVTRWARAMLDGTVLRPAQRRELLSVVSQKSGKPIATTTASDTHAFGLGVAQLFLPQIGPVWFYEGSTLGYRVVWMSGLNGRTIVAVALNSQPSEGQDDVGKLLTAVLRVLRAHGVT